MKHTSKAFTLVEAIVTLAVISLIILVGGGHFYGKPQISVKQWESSFDSHWQKTRSWAQSRQQDQLVNFDRQAVIFNHTKLAYPQHYICQTKQTIKILSTGYVAPTTIALSNGSEQLLIIFSLGGGEYRFAKGK